MADTPLTLADWQGRAAALAPEGRHFIGGQLLARSFPLTDRILILSGRASSELLQKSLLASIPIVVAIGAPSSLAVELAVEFNVTLIGFTSEKKFNIYSGAARISG